MTVIEIVCALTNKFKRQECGGDKVPLAHWHVYFHIVFPGYIIGVPRGLFCSILFLLGLKEKCATLAYCHISFKCFSYVINLFFYLYGSTGMQ